MQTSDAGGPDAGPLLHRTPADQSSGSARLRAHRGEAGKGGAGPGVAGNRRGVTALAGCGTYTERSARRSGLAPYPAGRAEGQPSIVLDHELGRNLPADGAVGIYVMYRGGAGAVGLVRWHRSLSTGGPLQNEGRSLATAMPIPLLLSRNRRFDASGLRYGSSSLRRETGNGDPREPCPRTPTSARRSVAVRGRSWRATRHDTRRPVLRLGTSRGILA